MLLLPASYFLSFLAVIGYNWDRYLLPVIVALALFAGRALAGLAGAGRVARSVRTLGVLAVLGWACLRAWATDRMLVRDSRFAIEAWASGRSAAGEKVFALGTPDNRQLPRLPAVAWRGLLRDVDFLNRSGADWVVVNESDTLLAGQGPKEQRAFRELLAGRHDFEPAFRLRAPDLLGALPEARHRCLVGIRSNLCLANPELVVFRRIQGGRVGRWRNTAGGDATRLVALAGKARALERPDFARVLDEEALCLDPGSLAARLGLVEDDVLEGWYEAAVARLEGAVHDHPEAAEPRLRLAALLGELGRREQARRLLALAAFELPGAAAVRLDLGRAERAFGRRSAAASELWAAAELAGPDERAGAAARDELRALGAAVELPAEVAWRDGVYPLEGTPQAPFRWTGPCALAETSSSGEPAELVAELVCGPEPAMVRIALDGAVGAEFLCAAERRVLRLPVEARTGRPRFPVPVSIEVRPSFLPGVVLGSSDPRELGVQVHALRVEPRANAAPRRSAAVPGRLAAVPLHPAARHP